MRLDVQCKGLTMTDSIQNHLDEKFHKIERLVPGEFDAQTILSFDANVGGGRFGAEISFRLWEHDLVSKSEGEDLYKVVSEIADKMLRQVVKLKDKRGKQRKGSTSIRGMEGIEVDLEEEQEEVLEKFSPLS